MHCRVSQESLQLYFYLSRGRAPSMRSSKEVSWLPASSSTSKRGKPRSAGGRREKRLYLSWIVCRNLSGDRSGSSESLLLQPRYGQCQGLWLQKSSPVAGRTGGELEPDRLASSDLSLAVAIFIAAASQRCIGSTEESPVRLIVHPSCIFMLTPISPQLGHTWRGQARQHFANGAPATFL